MTVGMDASVGETCRNVIAFVEIAVSPTASREERHRAYNALEEFKENSPLCAQCGMLLCAKENSPIVRHIGLQLIEHCIKLRWNAMSPDDKLLIKEAATRLVAEGTQGLLVEQAHIKDAVSRIIVEMVKREWPQQWPTFLQELRQLSSIGDTQTELMLLVLLRLAEDVVAFQNVQSQRRREIHQALVTNLSEIFEFFLTTLNCHYTKYREMKNLQGINGQTPEPEIHRRVTEATLKTLSGFVEWMPVKYIVENDGLLPKIFCYLLSDADLRSEAAECLLQVASRKGHPSERNHLISLFSHDVMGAILSASNSASVEPFEEKSYAFLKKLCQVIANLGSLLSSCWGSSNSEGGLPPMDLFETYLDALLATIRHPSQALNRITLQVWSTLLRHKAISELEAVRGAAPKLLKIATEKFVKVGYPSKNDDPACAYARLDCDSDEEFNALFTGFRADLSEMVRHATALNPIAGFQVASRWLHTLMAAKIEAGDASENGFCTSTSPSSVLWEGLVQFMDSVFSKMLSSPNPKPSVEEGIYLLEDVLRYNPEDPTIMSYALSCVSSLCVFLTLAPGSIPLVLDKIFACAVYKVPGEVTGKVRSRASRMLRRHAVAALVAQCKLHPKVMMPCFDQICATVQRLCAANEMSQMERVTATEAMVILSNERKDYRIQADFIAEVETPLVSVLSTPELAHAASSPEAFMAYVGLTEYPRDEAQDEEQGSRRSQLLRCSSAVMALVKNSWAPENMEDAVKGGFYVESGPGGKPYCRNPATPFVATVLQTLCQLMRVYNGTWTPEARSRAHEAFVTAYDMQDGEKNLVLGNLSRSCPPTDALGQKGPLEKLKSFIFSFQDQCLHVLGNAGEYLGPEFYSIEGLSQMLVASALSNLDRLPDYRLCPVVRSFVKPFVQHCPQELRMRVALPVLVAVVPFVYQKLNAKWETFRMKYGAYKVYEDEMTEEQEVLEDQLTRWLTRHFVDLLAAVLLNRRVQEPALDAVDQEQEGSPPVAPNSSTISDFGTKILGIEALCPYVVMSVFSALQWHDTVACMKALALASPLLKQMLQENVILDEGGAGYVLHGILKGLQTHGEHDLNQAHLVSLALQAYEALGAAFPGIVNVMLTIPGCTLQKLQAFEEKVRPGPTGKTVPEKKRKELFRTLVSPIIGRNIGQQFRASIEILNLPPIFKPRRRMAVDDDDAPEDTADGLATLFAGKET